MTFLDSCATEEEKANIELLQDNLLGMKKSMGDIFDLRKEHPDSLVYNIHAAGLQLFSETPKDLEKVEDMLEKAESLANTPWSKGVVEGFRLLQQGKDEEAGAKLTEIIKENKWDVFTCRLCMDIYFNMGMQKEMMATADLAWEVYSEHPLFQSAYAFCLEQVGRLDEAEELAKIAVTTRQDNPWGHHCLAHVYETTGRVKDGLAYMESAKHLWDDTIIDFINSHNYWHLALFYVAVGRDSEAVELFKEYVWNTKESPGIQLNAISLLWRLSLRGVEVSDDAWEEVLNYARPHLRSHLQTFQDLHYSICLAVCKDEEEMKEFEATMPSEGRWSLLRKANEILKAFYFENNAKKAVQLFEDVGIDQGEDAQTQVSNLAHGFIGLGGSNAQRGMLDHFLLVCSASCCNEKLMKRLCSRLRGQESFKAYLQQKLYRGLCLV
uniref:Tetratricopeptide repeat protein 38 n=1 Tax=Palpitomonas bilix TaxID=652834 RepID=A0A7S3DC13_9EUKA|mmetsp:Transcript_30257/g.78247  ORF Transcript_30257/g.78247 Transcript_30257/m.78247 type:complete len:438 (+) Transcript_30257:116-1429(+)